MVRILSVLGSPRRGGNASILLSKAIEGAKAEGAEVKELVLRDLNISPCLEIYGCKKTGKCVIEDDFHRFTDLLAGSRGLILASPIFFYSVSAHTKILIDRCQSLWVKKYWIEKAEYGSRATERKGLFISLGATKGKKLFDGALVTVKYFFDVLDMELWRSLLYRGLDFKGDVLKHPEYLKEAYESGRGFALALRGAMSR